jgi:hypothetical protein
MLSKLFLTQKLEGQLELNQIDDVNFLVVKEFVFIIFIMFPINNRRATYCIDRSYE